MSAVQEWSVDDVQQWMEGNGFETYTAQLCGKHRLDGNALLMLQEEDLRNEICLLGDRKRLLMSIHKLRSETPSLHEFALCDHIKLRKPGELLASRLDSECSAISEQLEDLEPPRGAGGSTGLASGGREGMMAPNLRPEYTKLIMAFVYMFSVFLLTAFVMVIVHDRVPDMKKYPPLPDIVLDNMPYVPWAFEMCELTGLVLLIAWLIILFFHKHRFILLRRMFSMTGTVFLLRCVTMLITSLSVPGVHLQCQPKTSGDIWYQMSRAVQIWRGGGMLLQGVRTCGDYMFSGHTVVVTMLNFLITEYTPRKLYWVHTASWILNIFGVFFILAAHEHYSIDVFIAFYITSRLFLYYHSLANNRALTQQDRKRTRIWFPLFSYFESGCNGIVPNEFEWPLPWPASAKRYFERSSERQRKKRS